MPRRRPDALQSCGDGFRVSSRQRGSHHPPLDVAAWAAAAAAAAFAYCRPLLPARSQVVFRQGGQLHDFGPLPSAAQAELACDVLSSECCLFRRHRFALLGGLPPGTLLMNPPAPSTARLMHVSLPQSRRRWTCSGRSTGCTSAASGRERQRKQTHSPCYPHQSHWAAAC